MKTSSMVWILVVVIVVLGLGWYFWTNSNTTVSQTPPASDQTNTNTAPMTSTTTGSTASAPMSATVTYDGNSFSPKIVTIAKGGTVTFTDTTGTMWVASDPHPIHNGYDGTTQAQHCAQGATPSFDECQVGNSYSFTFDKVGTWGYHDHLNHGNLGTVVVQ